jgi:hypothetical protein
MAMTESQTARYLEDLPNAEMTTGMRRPLSDYPETYKPRTIRAQARILRGVFPQLGPIAEKVATAPLPEGAEAYFAIPSWRMVAPTYYSAVVRVMGAIQAYLPIMNQPVYHRMRFRQLRECPRSVEAWRSIAEQQADRDFFVLPAQFGQVYAGRSARRSRDLLKESEFGLGAFAVGCMLLTHPERMSKRGDLGIDCAGDECVCPGVDRCYRMMVCAIHHPHSCGKDFVSIPFYEFSPQGARFSTRLFCDAIPEFGSATGFVPVSR